MISLIIIAWQRHPALCIFTKPPLRSLRIAYNSAHPALLFRVTCGRVNWSNPPLSLRRKRTGKEGGGAWAWAGAGRLLPPGSGCCSAIKPRRPVASRRFHYWSLALAGRMELGLSLGETMADAGRDLVLGLGMGVVGARREEEAAERGNRRDRDTRRELEFGTTGWCGARSSPEPPAVRLTLLPGLVPRLGGLPWPPPPPPPSSETNRHLEASTTRGFDVNRAPSLSVSVAGAGAAAAEEDEDHDEAGAAAAASSSPNNSAGSFPTDFSAQGGQVAPGGGGDRGACSRASDDDDGGSARKKLRLSKEQSAFLEESFKEHATLNPKQKLALAKQLNLRPRQVEVWFQNRRARTKLKQTEVDCEYLKRCCETLTEENRRLQKELAELRALKTVHPFYMHLPATTLSMCPSCERVASNSSAPAAAPVAPASSPSPAATGIAASSAPSEQQRPSSFAALFSSPLNRPLVAAQAQPQAPASS